MFFAILALFFFAFLPLPSLPVIIYIYQLVNPIYAFILNILAALLGVLVWYFLGLAVHKTRSTRLGKFLLPRAVLSQVSRLSSREIFLLRLSNTFVTKALNCSLGYSGYPFLSVLLINLAALIPWQFAYYLASIQSIKLTHVFDSSFQLPANYSILFSVISVCVVFLFLTSLATRLIRHGIK